MEFSDKHKNVSLTLTNACNLSCKYCYESNKNHSSMNLSTALSIVENELSINDYSEEITIELFGGEPFLEFQLIKNLVKLITEKKWEKPYKFFATTNGTLIKGEIKDWLLKNKEMFVCGLSLDGTKTMHNINRSNSFDEIDLDFFVQTYPNQPIKMTVSSDTLPFLYEGIKFCHSVGFKINANLAYGFDWSDLKILNILESQLVQLIDFYIENPNIEPCSLLNGDIKGICYFKNKSSIPKWCGAGSHMRSYDVNGQLYPCHFFMPITIQDNNWANLSNLLNKTEIKCCDLPSECQKCCINSCCPTCYGANYLENGSLLQKNPDYCKLTKIIIKARALLLAKKWERGLLKINPMDEQMLLKSILIIDNELVL